MLLIYRFLVYIFFPIIVLIIYLRTFLNKEDKNRYKEKLFSNSFNANKNHKKKLIWFHAASIGEFNSILPLIKKLKDDSDKYEFLITTVTFSSAKLINEKLLNEKNIFHKFFPVDKPSLAREFLNTWSPSLILFIDSEIWPNFIVEIKKKNIPLLLLNARITKKTFLRWSLISSFAKKIFPLFNLCVTSNEESKKYLLNFQVKNVKYFGNLKLTSDNKFNSLSNENYRILKENKFWCALSTHKTEEIFCLKTHLILKKNYNKLITIIIPRHTNRVQTIQNECSKLNLKSQILKKNEIINDKNEIIIINAYGVVSDYLNVCKSVFVGKSMIKKLKNVGGQNPIEAAKYGCKIYHGPFVYNFQELYDLLNKLKISELIENENQLSEKLISDFKNSNEKVISSVQTLNKLGDEILNQYIKEIKKYI